MQLCGLQYTKMEIREKRFMDTSNGSIGTDELSDSDLETVVGGAGDASGLDEHLKKEHAKKHEHEHHKGHHEGKPGTLDPLKNGWDITTNMTDGKPGTGF
jgi:hypothetical protein